ncbi:MAG: hypothetical protein ACOYMM_07720 [Phycisphaerales bacterium]|jgi:hypothetical protein
MPPELKPLFAIVIVLAIAHTLLKFRARAAAGRARRAARTTARGASAATTTPNAPIDAAELAGLSAEDALARLRESSARTPDTNR